jgi:ligand-binding sensor domain-containing protein
VDKHGNLWGTSFGEAAVKNPHNNQPYFLARFDKSNGKFETVENEKLSGDVVTYSEDSSGLLYFYTSDKHLLKFNPDSGKAELLEFNFPYYEVKSMAIDRNNNIWFSGSFEENGIRDTSVLRYSLKGNSNKNIDSLLGSGRYNAGVVFIDSSDRLWLQDYCYLDNVLADEPSWYQVIKSPIFIHNRGPVELDYYWDEATPIYESKDHKLWFFSGAGLAYLDQSAQKWCLLTSRITGVAEDSSNNLWIVDRGQIYKREKIN